MTALSRFVEWILLSVLLQKDLTMKSFNIFYNENWRSIKLIMSLVLSAYASDLLDLGMGTALSPSNSFDRSIHILFWHA